MTRADNPFGPLANPLVAAAALTLWIALLLLFRGEPQWDLDTARRFFDAAACAATGRANGMGCAGGFPLGTQAFFGGIRAFLHPLPTLLGIVVLVVLLVEIWMGKRWRDA
ncbi:MAG: hypothetical protein WAU86_18255, partial [Oricola sp.]